MDAHQDHKNTAGHEGHGVHTCHRCGWPFPNPHPSAKHRRAHKKVCGTIEGYIIVRSEDDGDSRLAVSVEEHASDDDVNSPSPKLVKEKSSELSGGGGVGEKSIKTEDDVFSDAATEFSDGGINKNSEERYDSTTGKEENDDQKGLEITSQPPTGDETSEKTEQHNYSTSCGQMSNPEAPMNANYRSDHVAFLADNVDIVNAQTLVGLRDSVQPNPTKEDVLASEGKISDPSLMAVEGIKDLSDKLTSPMVDHDVSPRAETPENRDTSAKEQSIANSDELADSTNDAVGKILLEETHETNDASVVEKVFDSANDSGSIEALVEDTSIKPSVEESNVSSLDKDGNGKTYLIEDQNVGNSDSSGVENHDMDGNKNGNLESDDKLPTETVSAVGLVDNSSAPESDQTSCTVEKDANSCDGKSNSVELLEAGNETGREDTVEIQREVDCSVPYVNFNPLPSSHKTDTDALYLEEGSSKTEASKLESSDIVAETNFEVIDRDKVTETSHVRVESVISGELVYASEQDSHVVKSGETLEQPSSKDPMSQTSESIVAAEVSNEHNLDSDIVAESVKLDNSTSTVPEALPMKQECVNESITHANGHESKVDVEKSDISVANPSSEDREPSPSDLRDSHETSVIIDDKNIDKVEHVGGIISKPLQDISDEKVKEQKYDLSGKELSGALSSRSDSLEANFGSVSAQSQSSDILESNEKQKHTGKEAEKDRSEDFEPPSFMTLVQHGVETNQETGASEIGTVQNNQSATLQAGWFPSLTNVVNESEGRKKNEEMIAKVTNWSPAKQHGPLKLLQNEVRSPNTKHVLTANQKDEAESKENVAADLPKDQESKVMDEWNSPARYPIEIKKEKAKKKKPYWVPFVCCSSVHGDL